MSARGHLSTDEGGAVMHGEFMAFATDDDSISVLRGWAERQGFPAATVQPGGPDMFAQMLEASAPPKMAIIDCDGQADPVAVAMRLVSLCGPENKLIIIGSANDVDLYRRMLGVGVVDYLVKPLSTETLNQAMAAALRGGGPGKPEARDAKVVVMIGVRGGVGASTIAVNTGWILAHEIKLNCALLDLDLQFGTSSLALDLEPGRGLRDIVSSPHRVDGLMIASSMVSESDNFSVLGAEEAVDEAVLMDSSAVTALIKEMKGNFDIMIVDLPRHLLAAQKRLLTAAHEIVLVTELSLAGIRDTLRIKTALNALGCTATLSVIAARGGGASHTGQINQSAFEKGAQIKIDLIIPQDDKVMAEASNSGKAIRAVARNAPITKSLLTLAQKLSGKTAADVKKSGGGLWSKLSGEAKRKAKPKEWGKA